MKRRLDSRFLQKKSECAITIVLLLAGCGTHGEYDSGNHSPDDSSDDGGLGSGGRVRPVDNTGGNCASSCSEGPAGAQGEPGQDGYSCSVLATDEGARILCEDGTSADVRNGTRGLTGLTGLQGPSGVQGPTGPAGPTGPQGAQGSQGPQGAQGPAGPRGLSGMVDTSKMYKVTATVAINSSQPTFGTAAACDPGDFLLTGGCHTANPANPGLIRSSYPIGQTSLDDVPTIWQCAFAAAGSSVGVAYAFCVDM